MDYCPRTTVLAEFRNAICCFHNIHSQVLLFIMHKLLICSYMCHKFAFLRRHFPGYAMQLMALTVLIFKSLVPSVSYIPPSQHGNCNFRWFCKAYIAQIGTTTILSDNFWSRETVTNSVTTSSGVSRNSHKGCSTEISL